MISVSIVSHGHGDMVSRLVAQLQACPEVGQIIVTRNVPEALNVPGATIVDNPEPKGFGANHNAAFKLCDQPYWCVLNPDIELIGNPFPILLGLLQHDRRLGMVAPLVRNPGGQIEDSVRRFPTVFSIMAKVLGVSEGRHPIDSSAEIVFPDWVAGMFMLYSSEAYEKLGGFDERYFLYYEDVDICARAWRARIGIAVATSVAVVHDARRTSHRNLRYLRWHLSSMLRFLLRFSGRMPSPFPVGR